MNKIESGIPNLNSTMRKKEQLMQRQAQQISSRQLMSDPYFKQIYKRNTLNSAESVRDRSQRTAIDHKEIDLLEGSSIGVVKSVVNYE
jgi:hypothetical protein